MSVDSMTDPLHRAFASQIPDMSFDEYRNQDVLTTGDGEFFDALDEAFGIVPGTDELA